jgi:hypothetical protein
MTNIFARLLAACPNVKRLSGDIGIGRNRLYALASGKSELRASDYEIAKAAQAIYLWERYLRDMKHPPDIATEDLELYRRELNG